MVSSLIPLAFLLFKYKTRQDEVEEGKSKKEIEYNKLLRKKDDQLNW